MRGANRFREHGYVNFPTNRTAGALPDPFRQGSGRLRDQCWRYGAGWRRIAR